MSSTNRQDGCSRYFGKAPSVDDDPSERSHCGTSAREERHDEPESGEESSSDGSYRRSCFVRAGSSRLELGRASVTSLTITATVVLTSTAGKPLAKTVDNACA